MAKIDADKLTKRINQLDPYYYDSVTMKWEILKIIKAMEEKKEN